MRISDINIDILYHSRHGFSKIKMEWIESMHRHAARVRGTACLQKLPDVQGPAKITKSCQSSRWVHCPLAALSAINGMPRHCHARGYCSCSPPRELEPELLQTHRQQLPSRRRGSSRRRRGSCSTPGQSRLWASSGSCATLRSR
eukprot:SAG11_NODE_1145_length_5693_cov_23.401323_2_plen_144_part_00